MTESIPLSRDEALVVLCGFSLALPGATGPRSVAYALDRSDLRRLGPILRPTSPTLVETPPPPPAQSTR